MSITMRLYREFEGEIKKKSPHDQGWKKAGIYE